MTTAPAAPQLAQLVTAVPLPRAAVEHPVALRLLACGGPAEPASAPRAALLGLADVVDLVAALAEADGPEAFDDATAALAWLWHDVVALLDAAAPAAAVAGPLRDAAVELRRAASEVRA